MTSSYRTFYVNQKTGCDTNDGLTMASPFASLFSINRQTLKPGDKVLLAQNSIFTGQFLQIKDSGTKEHPIEIGAYSPDGEEGNMPLMQPMDRVSGTRIMGHPWIPPITCIRAMYPQQYFCTMQSI